MGRVRTALEAIQEGQLAIARFLHPVSRKTARIKLGPWQTDKAKKALEWVNFIFLHPDRWKNPAGVPDEIREAWLGASYGVRLTKKTLTVDGKRRDHAEMRQLRNELARVSAIVETQNGQVAELHAKLKSRTKQLEDQLGHRVREGPCPTLGAALDAWLTVYEADKGRDSDHKKNVHNDLKLFEKHFRAETPLDDLDKSERKLNTWLVGLGVSAGRRNQMRTYVIKMLEDSGLRINRAEFPAATLSQKQKDSVHIRWLERAQAEAISNKLPDYWRDIFRVQVGTGLRPDELITLKKADFSTDLSELTLSPHKHLTLKLGPRTLKIPETVREIIKRRLETNVVVFPDPKTNALWRNAKAYNKRFNKALNAAAKDVVPFTIDCRTGRRTCASLLLRAGSSVESVASLLGDNTKTVLKHYARILSKEVDASAAAI